MAKIEDPKGLVRTGYDNIAPAYLDFISSLPSPTIAWTDKLLALLQSAHSPDVLELGCGNGVPCTAQNGVPCTAQNGVPCTAHLAPKVAHVTANDISSAQITLAKDNLAGHRNVTFMQRDMTTLSLPPSSFDAVSALYSLVHLPLTEQPKVLKLINTWLKPSGYLLCNFDVEEDTGSVMDDWLGTKMFKAGHGVEGSKTMVREARFEILEAEVVETVDGKKTVPFLWILATKPEHS